MVSVMVLRELPCNVSRLLHHCVTSLKSPPLTLHLLVRIEVAVEMFGKQEKIMNGRGKKSWSKHETLISVGGPMEVKFLSVCTKGNSLQLYC